MIGNVTIDCDFPGGNVLVREIEGDDVHVDPDLRDTEGPWFYWYFRVRGACGRTLRFHFGSDVIGTRGPVVSVDGGRRWRRHAANDRRAFTYSFSEDEGDVRFAFTIPYVEDNLEAFLESHRENPRLEVDTLGTTDKGRSIEVLRVRRGAREANAGEAPARLLLTCRHHACEATANYVLEGILESILSGEDATWFARRVECLVVPFVDKDGVEDGDQGKNRRPRDHNRDYDGESVHASVRALRRAVHSWSDGRPLIALDLHCPHIRGSMNEKIYLVGSERERIWEEQQAFGRILEWTRRGPLPYRAGDNLPFNSGWNTANNYRQGKSFAAWACDLPGIRLSSTIEIPYANVYDSPVTPSSARQFGSDLATALRHYINQIK